MSEDKKFIRIGELAGRTNKTVRALHLYEELGLLEPAHRTASGYRMYDESNVDRIEYVNRLQCLGLSLNDIVTLIKDWGGESSPQAAMERVRVFYQERLENVREKMNGLRALEVELLISLNYLEGCTSCSHDDHNTDACGSCVQSERSDEEVPNLITGLTAH